jgi:hypothetical protein
LPRGGSIFVHSSNTEFQKYVPNEMLQKKLELYISQIQSLSRDSEIATSIFHETPIPFNLRQAIVIGLKYRSLDMGNFVNWNDYSKEALTFNINNLINDIPFIDLDFTSL